LALLPEKKKKIFLFHTDLAAQVQWHKFGGAESQVRRLCLLLCAPSSVAHPPSFAASSALACRSPPLCRLLALELSFFSLAAGNAASL
jgi:hypothetical protein